MNHSLSLVVVAALVTAATATGCAAATEPEAKGRSHANEEIGTGGGGPDAIFLKVDEQSILWRELDGTQGNVIVCANSADPGLVSQLQGSSATPYVVVQKMDGSYDSRTTDKPTYEQDTLLCSDSGPAYIFHLREQSVDFLTTDLSGAFISGFTGKNIQCDVGFRLTKGLDFDLQGMRVENGVLKQPELNIRLEGDSDGAATAHCELKATSPVMVFAAGPVPVVYELEMGIGLTISLSKASHVSASIGTSGGSITTDDPQITITPEVEMGVTFYGVVGGYVGIGFPVKVTPHLPCSPDIDLSAEVKVGAQAGLLGIGELPITKALSVEVSSPVLGPFHVATSQCN